MTTSTNDRSTRMSAQGSASAQLLWEKWDQAGLSKDPRDPIFAEAALDRFIHCLKSRSAVDKKAIAGAARSAEQLNVSEFHGIAELIQNADDLGASRVTVRLKKKAGQSFLYVVHDGDPIEIQHVLPIVTAYLTTKEDDPFTKGKFGIGLKTCARFSDGMDAHCAPYHFGAIGQSLTRLEPIPPIPGFFLNDGRHTLFILRLRKDFDPDGFRAWLERFEASSLLFLSSVREFTVKTGPKHEYQFRLNTPSSGKDRSIKIRGQQRRLSTRYFESGNGKEHWHRYSVIFPVPKALKRRFKKIANETIVSVGIPRHVCTGRLFAGLPTEIQLHTPILIDAQFDPDASRERLISSLWNQWLVRRSGDVLVAAAIELFACGQACCWKAVPLPDENPQYADWLTKELSSVLGSAAQTIAKRAKIKVGRNLFQWDRIAYCDKHLEHLVDSEDVRAITDAVELIPKARRDPQERWRKILNHFENANLISTYEALQLFEMESRCQEKTPSWFVYLAYQAVTHGFGHNLFSYPSILLEDGKQIRPQRKDETTEILVVKTSRSALAEDKNVSRRIHSVYSKSRPAAEAVTNFFKEHGNLFDAPDAFNALLALANKGAGKPFDVDDKNLLGVRDLFSQLDKETAEELGPKLGKAIRVDAFTWNGKRRISKKAVIGDCYLPSSIEKEKYGWSVAARRTPGLVWLSPHYGSLLAAKEKGRSNSKRRVRSGRKMGGRAFFHALGAETAPRLRISQGEWQGIYFSLDETLPHSQKKKFSQFSSVPEALLGNSESEDMFKVLKDICQTKQKKERKTRVFALFETLSKNWQRCYMDFTHATVGYHYYRWHRLGKIPSSWIAQLMDHAWLVNEAGEPKKPTELGSRNSVTLAVYGNAPAFFAAGLGSEGDRPRVAKNLGIEIDPMVSSIVDLIEEMKNRGDSPDEELLRLRYAALSRLCPNDLDTVKPKATIGDLTVAKLRARFGTRRSADGLIYTNNSWVSVGGVFLGKQVFHGRRAFVPSGAELSRLWKVLGVHRPSVRDCVAVLEEIAEARPTLDDKAILIETYRYIDAEISKASANEVRQLVHLPLRCGNHWKRKRPIYYVSDQRLAQNVAKFARVWIPPCNVEGLKSFLVAANVLRVEVDSFSLIGVESNTVIDDSSLTHLFQSALRLLREYLVLNSEEAYHSTKISWDELLSAEPRVAPSLGILFGLPGYQKKSVDINAYLALNKGIFWFRHEELIASKEAGGHLVWECFGNPRHREIIELAWVNCWHQAQQGQKDEGIELSKDERGIEDPLSAIEQAAKRSSRRRSSYSRQSEERPKTQRTARQEATKVRRLKALSELETTSVTILNEDGEIGGIKARKINPLRTDIPQGQPAKDYRGSRSVGRKSYDNQQLEEHALRCLHHVLTTADLGELRDLRRFRNVGADSILELKEFFEIKASAGEMPSAVELTRSEVARSKREGKNFYLAIISGLEKGFETTVRIYNDPIRTLDWSPSAKVVFTGLNKKRHLALTISEPRANQDDVQGQLETKLP